VAVRLRVGFVVCVLLCATAAGTALSWQAANADLARTRAQRADQAAASLRSALALADEDVRGIAALFNTQTQVDPDVFAGYVASPLGSGAIDAAHWVKLVPGILRREYERRMGFPIVQIAAAGHPVPAARRAVYYPVTYTAARPGTWPLAGSDIALDPARSAAMRAAVVSGLVQATTAVEVAAGVRGVTLFQPIYATIRTPRTVSARWQQLTGVAAVSIRGDTLARRASAGQTARLTLSLRVDGRVVYGSPRDAAGAAVRSFGFDGQVVRIAAAAHDGGANQLTAWIVLTAGLVLTALVGLLLQRSASREAFGERLVAERTAELQTALAEVEQARATADHLSRHDPVTDVYNRRHLLQMLERTLARAQHDGERPAIFVLDVDHFKEVNDAFGHAAGDQALRAVASMIGSAVRPGDTVARWGGEEFCVLVPDVPSAAALYRIGESLRHAVEEHAINLAGETVHVTVSVGCARAATGATQAATLIAAADESLYRAKRGGRNQTEIAAGP
jgi:diguanylate cyclase (GGDEF)-like protein